MEMNILSNINVETRIFSLIQQILLQKVIKSLK